MIGETASVGKPLSVVAVSAEPPVLIFSVSDLSSSSPALRLASTVVVHLIDADRIDIAKLGSTSDIDRFANTGIWARLPTGEPYFTGVKLWIRGEVIEQFRVGSATVIAVHAVEAQLSPRSPALVHHSRAWYALGPHSEIAG
ncbi:flavin reductase family protein [Mycetocola sp. 2940]|uniref:flavin reductase family protein n=1 Tax=Mycetocola sp. 2940 TaxID=3156452 RepID=UPI00339504B1